MGGVVKAVKKVVSAPVKAVGGLLGLKAPKVDNSAQEAATAALNKQVEEQQKDLEVTKKRYAEQQGQYAMQSMAARRARGRGQRSLMSEERLAEISKLGV
jgi:hypothetical protein